jgi:TonB family protein
MKFSAVLILLIVLASGIYAQRPRTIDTSDTSGTVKPTPPPAPASVKAKYEGGVFGYRKKQDGYLVFDDVNSRLVFKDKKQKEVLFIPYDAVTQAFADTQSRRPTAATVAGSIPVPYGLNLPAMFIKKKYRYLTLQFYDDNSRVNGVTSFKLSSKELVESVTATLANKAELVPRGEIYVRDRQSGVTPDDQAAVTRTSGTWPVETPGKPAVFVENEALSNRVISLPRPNYPEQAKASRLSGTVRVLVTVDESGRIADAEAVSGPSVLQAAAVDAAKQALFEPVVREGKPIKMKAVIAYTFYTT